MFLSENTISQIKQLINRHKVLVFIKGSHLKPACSFSAKTIVILNQCNVAFHAINVLEDSLMRENIKIYSEWPTIPQIYIDGEFIGGFDVLNHIHQTSELQEILEKTFSR